MDSPTKSYKTTPKLIVLTNIEIEDDLLESCKSSVLSQKSISGVERK